MSQTKETIIIIKKIYKLCSNTPLCMVENQIAEIVS